MHLAMCCGGEIGGLAVLLLFMSQRLFLHDSTADVGPLCRILCPFGCGVHSLLSNQLVNQLQESPAWTG